jgi:two-component system LytT family response regulator
MKPLTAMIIDDEPFAREDLRYMLSEHREIDVRWEAGKIGDARRILKENKPDIVFLDIQLRGGSGFDLLPDIPEGKTRVIFVTAHDQYTEQALSSNAIDCLLKPVSAERLADSLEKLKKANL